jgi:hypothetical protein
MFGRQASGEGAYTDPRADEDAAPHIYLYALLYADVAPHGHLHVHADPAD